MPTTKSGKQVGDEMSLYSFRPGPVREAFPRGGEREDFAVRIFDKGHFRAVGIAPGNSKLINGRKIQVNGDGHPVGFTKIPLKLLLKYYGSRFTLNVRKMERALEDYHRQSLEYQKLREESEQVRRPRRPTLKSLYLERPTEFEFFLQPYISFYCNRLKVNFPSLVKLAEKKDDRVFREMNELYHPDGDTDNKVTARFESAGIKFVLVRLSEPFDFTEAPPESAPIGTKPYVISEDDGDDGGDEDGGDDDGGEGGGDEEKTEAELFLEDQEIRGVEYACLYMKPWECVRVNRNPFKSQTYQLLYKNAQALYWREFMDFNFKMSYECNQYNKDFAKYYEMKRQMRDASVDLKSIEYADRPQSRNFMKEWREFIFMMLEKMRKHRIYADAPLEIGEETTGERRGSDSDELSSGGETKRTGGTIIDSDSDFLVSKIVSEPLGLVTKRALKTVKMKPLQAVAPRVPFLKEKAVTRNVPEDPDLAMIMRDKSYSKGVVMI